MVGPSPIKKPPKIAPKKDLGDDSVKGLFHLHISAFPLV
mgnify:CR=1 FL=1